MGWPEAGMNTKLIVKHKQGQAELDVSSEGLRTFGDVLSYLRRLYPTAKTIVICGAEYKTLTDDLKVSSLVSKQLVVHGNVSETPRRCPSRIFMLLHENIDLDVPLTVDNFDLLQTTGKLEYLSSDRRVQPFQIWGASDFPYLIAVREFDDRHKIKVIIQDRIRGHSEVETNDSEFVWQLKNELANQQRAPDQKLLLYNGHRELHDLEELREAGITTGSVLYPLWESESIQRTPMSAGFERVTDVLEFDIRLPGGQSVSISCQPSKHIKVLKLDLLQTLTKNTGFPPTAQDIISGCVTDEISSITSVSELQTQLRRERTHNSSLTERLDGLTKAVLSVLTHVPQSPSRDVLTQQHPLLPLTVENPYAAATPQYATEVGAEGEPSLLHSIQPHAASPSGERGFGPDLGAQVLRPQPQRVAVALAGAVESGRIPPSGMVPMHRSEWTVSSPPTTHTESRQLGFRPVGQQRLLQQRHSPVPADTVAEMTGLPYGLQQHQRGFQAGAYQANPPGGVTQQLGVGGWQGAGAQTGALGIPSDEAVHPLGHHLPGAGVPAPVPNAAFSQLQLEQILQLLMQIQAGAGHAVQGAQMAQAEGGAPLPAQPAPLAPLPLLHPGLMPPAANVAGFPQFASLLTALGLPGQPYQGQQLQGQQLPTNLLDLPQQLGAGVPQPGQGQAARDRQTRKRRAPADRLRAGEHVEYLDRVPPKEEFEKKLKEFYADNNMNYSVPIVEGGEMDFHFIFEEVAKRGGYEAVVVHRQWRQIGITWRDDLRHVTNASTLLKNKYERHLLAFEKELSKGATRRAVFSDWGKVAEEQRAMKKMREERHYTGAPAGRLGKRRVSRQKEHQDLAVPTTASETSLATGGVEGVKADTTAGGTAFMGLNLMDLSLRSQPPSVTTTPRPDSPRLIGQGGNVEQLSQIGLAPLGTTSAIQNSPDAASALASLALSESQQASQQPPPLPVTSGPLVNVEQTAHLPEAPEAGLQEQ
eukprot:jgi/Botrbrau1/2045/Bobra.0047s0022.1